MGWGCLEHDKTLEIFKKAKILKADRKGNITYGGKKFH